MFKRTMLCTALVVCLYLSPVQAQFGIDDGPRGNSGAITMRIDVMPGWCPNSVFMSPVYEVYTVRPGRAVAPDLIAVAVAGTPTLQAAAYDPTTANLEGVSPLRYEFRDIMAADVPEGGPCACRRSMPDGLDDVVLYFPRGEFVAAMEPIVDTERRMVQLDMMYGGYMQSGLDCVRFYTSVKTISPAAAELPAVANLVNYPNPFNAETVITFELGTPQDVTLDVYDVLGRHVARLMDGLQAAGVHSVGWDGIADNGARLGSGMYFYRVQSRQFSEVRKMILLR